VSFGKNMHFPYVPEGFALNSKIKMNGLDFLRLLQEGVFPVAFFDPQYRGILDKQKYGNEGVGRGWRRCALKQMDECIINQFVCEISRILAPSGHMFLWIDKFHLCSGFRDWFSNTDLDIVDLISWDKGRIGMGYRTRRRTEYCVVLQKIPRRAKGVWTKHDIPDTWREEITNKSHVHQKPVMLQSKLIDAVTSENDVVIDPAAGSYSVMEAAANVNRNFLGCDIADNHSDMDVMAYIDEDRARKSA